MYRYLLAALSAVMLLGTTLTTYTQPTVIQTKVATATSAAGASITFTQTPAPGDVELCSATHNAGSGATITFAAGFTATASGQVNVSTSLAAARAYHVVGSSESPTIAATTSATVGSLIFGCEEVAYVSASSPIMADGCVSSASPAALFSGPTLQPLAPTVASSFFAALGTLTDTPQNGAVTNFDTAAGMLNARDQHSTPLYAFQDPFSAALQYNLAPSAAIACTTLLAPIITPFTVSAVAVVATPTPAPTPTTTPPPFGGAPTHVMTAEYLWSSAEEATAPSAYAPYLSIAYAKPSREQLTQSAGIKVIHYTSEQLCNIAAVPTCADTVEYPLITGTYANAQATSCTGTTSFGYSGKYYVTNMLPAYSNGIRTVQNASAYYSAAFPALISWLQSASQPGYVPDYWFIDNAETYGVSPTPCNDSSWAIWATGIANTFSAVTTPPKIFLNALGWYTMTMAQAQQNTLNSSNVYGAQYEACYGGHGGSYGSGDWVTGTDKTWLEAQYGEIQTILKSKIFWCYNENIGDGASRIPARLYMYASFLLAYNPTYAIFQTAMATTPSTFKVFPETGFVPTGPSIAVTAISQLKASTGLYVQHYSACSYRGVNKGACEIVVNPDPSSTFAIPSNTFTHTLAISGDGVLDGGSVTFNGPIVTSLGPTSAAILMP